MKCKVFMGGAKNVGNDVNKWMEEIEERKSREIISVTQSFEEAHGNMILTIIYRDYENFLLSSH